MQSGLPETMGDKCLTTSSQFLSTSLVVMFYYDECTTGPLPTGEGGLQGGIDDTSSSLSFHLSFKWCHLFFHFTFLMLPQRFLSFMVFIPSCPLEPTAALFASLLLSPPYPIHL